MNKYLKMENNQRGDRFHYISDVRRRRQKKHNRSQYLKSSEPSEKEIRTNKRMMHCTFYL